MARLCIRATPNNNLDDPKLDLFRMQPGDIVCIVEDDHKWSAAELNCGQYRFVEVPGVAPGVFDYLVAPTFDVEEKMVRVRNVGLDPDAFKAGAWRNRTTATKSQIDAIVVTKA